MTKFKLNIFFAIIFLLFLFIVNNTLAAINIPIIISEAIPDGTTGINRVNEPVTVGIPLPEGTGITSVEQLGLTGTSVGQFRVLKRHPNNEIWWVLVDTQTSLNANSTASIALVDGTGNFGGENLATESSDTVTITTGNASFSINKSNFNLFDVVNVNGSEIISSGNNGQVILTVGGTTYSSKNTAATVSIEENGPARCVIKATGRLASTDGAIMGGYILRLHFYKGKSYVRCDTEISNAYQDANGPVYIDEAKLQIPLNIGNNLNYQFGYNNTTTSGAVTGSAWIYQGNYGQYGDRAPDTGLEIGNNGSPIHTLGNSGDYSDGWAILDNGTIGLVAGIQQLKINEPAGIEFSDNGLVDISLVSSHKSSAIVLQGGQHILNIIHLNFFDDKPDGETALNLSQYPLVARTTLDNYNAAGGIYGISLVSVNDERAFFSKNNHTFPEENIINTLREHVNRNYTWATSGTPNSDWNLKYLMDFLRTGHGALFLSAIQGAIHNGCVATMRSDDFNYFESYKDYEVSSSLWGQAYDEAHTFWEGMAYLYLTTGNEFYKDSIIDFGEWLEEYIKHTGYRSYYSLSYSRNWSRSYRNMGILSWVLESTHYATVVDDMTSLLFKTPDTDNVHYNGINYERGYILPSHGISSDFMTSKLFPQSLQIVAFSMGTNWNSYEKLQDTITGLGFFIYGEFYGDTGNNCGDFGYPYNYDIDATYTGTYRSKQSEIALSHAYYNSGNIAYLTRATRVMFGDIDCLWGNTVASELGVHALITATTKEQSGSIEVGYVSPQGNGRVDIHEGNLVDNNDGTYTLRWTVPIDNIEHYQIKFSTQPLVDNLNFNQQTRKYDFDPVSYDNFWASLNIRNEPSPLPIGANQEIVVDVQKVISDYNNRYGLTTSDTGYIAFNIDAPLYFAIKYFSNKSNILKPVIIDINVE